MKIDEYFEKLWQKHYYRETAMTKKINSQTDDSFVGIVNTSKDYEINELKSIVKNTVKNLLEDSERKLEHIAILEHALRRRPARKR